ncbi:hypothetical protein [Rhodococcus sp. 14C212]|uniref:hypothetical protein n=1 Tax=Rhodococcus sp. 14C212 TaxID=2711209 RepID=UPI00197E4ACD|nr:hypothetical protein [Rhodococcus sp. 14C212]
MGTSTHRPAGASGADGAYRNRRTRSLDVSVEQDELRQGRTAVAVPVRDDGVGIVGCLAAIGGTGRIRTDDRDLIDLLHEYAGRLRLPGAARRP